MFYFLNLLGGITDLWPSHPMAPADLLRASLLLNTHPPEHVKVTINRRRATRHRLDPTHGARND